MTNSKVKKTEKRRKKMRRKDPHETLTLKYWLIGALVVLLVAGGVITASVLLARASVREFTYANGVLTRVEDGRIYLKADEPFEVLFPISRDQEGTPYGECESFKVYKVGYYNKYGNLKEMDSDNYLTDGVYFYFSYYVQTPTLEKFNADTVRIGEMSADEKSRLYLVSFTEDEASEFVEAYLVGKRYQGASEGVRTYCVQLTSAEYSYLSYMLYAVECEDGSWYMYSKTDRTSIAMDSAWFDSLKAKLEDEIDNDNPAAQ